MLASGRRERIKMLRFVKKAVRKVLLALIVFYRKFISPIKPPCCRFYPTCSVYAHQAISKYGAIKGTAKSVYRILRCNPFGKGGYDPVK